VSCAQAAQAVRIKAAIGASVRIDFIFIKRSLFRDLFSRSVLAMS
jgi:hypothetical protein